MPVGAERPVAKRPWRRGRLPRGRWPPSRRPSRSHRRPGDALARRRGPEERERRGGGGAGGTHARTPPCLLLRRSDASPRPRGTGSPGHPRGEKRRTALPDRMVLGHSRRPVAVRAVPHGEEEGAWRRGWLGGRGATRRGAPCRASAPPRPPRALALALLAALFLAAPAARAFDLDDVAKRAEAQARQAFRDPAGEVPVWLRGQLRPVARHPVPSRPRALARPEAPVPGAVLPSRPVLRPHGQGERGRCQGQPPGPLQPSNFDYGRNEFGSRIPRTSATQGCASTTRSRRRTTSTR